jgi:hypothetical protein
MCWWAFFSILLILLIDLCRLINNQSVYPLAKIAADFNSANFKSIWQPFGEQNFDNFFLKFSNWGQRITN